MKCKFMLDDKKCILELHKYSKKDLALNQTNKCEQYLEGKQCKYFEKAFEESFNSSIQHDFEESHIFKIQKKRKFAE